MFIDASAIVAILTGEPEADAFADLIEQGPSRITSPIAVFEAVLGICRKRKSSVEKAQDAVREFIELAKIEVIPIAMTEAETALDAFARYGKGRGHSAQLNLGDCFAYAAARNHRTSLLFKGEDFAKTDLRRTRN